MFSAWADSSAHMASSLWDLVLVLHVQSTVYLWTRTLPCVCSPLSLIVHHWFAININRRQTLAHASPGLDTCPCPGVQGSLLDQRGRQVHWFLAACPSEMEMEWALVTMWQCRAIMRPVASLLSGHMISPMQSLFIFGNAAECGCCAATMYTHFLSDSLFMCSKLARQQRAYLPPAAKGSHFRRASCLKSIWTALGAFFIMTTRSDGQRSSFRCLVWSPFIYIYMPTIHMYGYIF